MSQLVVLPANASRPAVYFATEGVTWATLYRITQGVTQAVTFGNSERLSDNSVRHVAVVGGAVFAAGTSGLHRTDDAGVTWRHVLSVPDGCTHVVGAGSRVYASCGGIYRSIANGAFELVNNEYGVASARLAVSPSNPDVIYAASSGIFRSTDGARTWTKTIDLYDDRENPVHRALYGELEAVCKGEYQPYWPWSDSMSFAVDPTNPAVVWIGQAQLFRSSDGAQTFGRASTRTGDGSDSHALPPAIRQPVFRGGAIYVPTRKGIYRTSNPGAGVQYGDASICSRAAETPEVSWTQRSKGINGQQFREVAVAGDGSVLATTATDQGLYYSDLDAPGRWLLMSEEAPSRIFVDPAAGLDRFYTAGCWPGQLCRYDAVQSGWVRSIVADYGHGGLSFVAFEPGNRDRVWAGIGFGLYRSSDGLANGTYVGNVAGCATTQGAVSPSNPNTLVLVNGCGQVSRRDDAWSAKPPEWPYVNDGWATQELKRSPANFNAVLFDPADPRRVYITGDREPSVFMSTNAGITWRALDAPGNADGLPDSDIRTIAIDPVVNDVVFLGSRHGRLFVGWSVDSASEKSYAWHEVQTPFSGAPIEKLVVWPQPDGSRRLFVFTNGGGMWSVAIDVAHFADVAIGSWSNDHVRRLLSAGITSGCATEPLRFCPSQPVTRDQMAVFLLRAKYGSAYRPPDPTGLFVDVPAGHWAQAWVERLRTEGITSGCASPPMQYCPAAEVTRDQMALFLLRAKYGAAYQPPVATGMFADVEASHWAAPWIEQLAREGVTGGCSTSPRMYCPQSVVTREQMAVFLVRTFGL